MTVTKIAHLLTLILLLSTATVYGQRQDKKLKSQDVPAPAMNALMGKYGYAKNFRWFLAPGGQYEAAFTDTNGRTTSAFFTAQGEWLKTKAFLDKKKLPKAILTEMRKNYSDAYIDRAALMREPNQDAYFLILILQNAAYERLSFSIDGELLNRRHSPDGTL